MCGCSAHVLFYSPCVGALLMSYFILHVWALCSCHISFSMCGHSAHVIFHSPCVGALLMSYFILHVWALCSCHVSFSMCGRSAHAIFHSPCVGALLIPYFILHVLTRITPPGCVYYIFYIILMSLPCPNENYPPMLISPRCARPLCPKWKVSD